MLHTIQISTTRLAIKSNGIVTPQDISCLDSRQICEDDMELFLFPLVRLLDDIRLWDENEIKKLLN